MKHELKETWNVACLTLKFATTCLCQDIEASRKSRTSRVGATMRKILGLCLLFSAFAAESHATSITFATPTGSSTGGGPVNSLAMFTTSLGQVSITLTDLQANPTDVAQLLSDLDFVLSGGITTGALTSSSGQQIFVNGNGTTSLG